MVESRVPEKASGGGRRLADNGEQIVFECRPNAVVLTGPFYLKPARNRHLLINLCFCTESTSFRRLSADRSNPRRLPLLLIQIPRVAILRLSAHP